MNDNRQGYNVTRGWITTGIDVEVTLCKRCVVLHVRADAHVEPVLGKTTLKCENCNVTVQGSGNVPQTSKAEQ